MGCWVQAGHRVQQPLTPAPLAAPSHLAEHLLSEYPGPPIPSSTAPTCSNTTPAHQAHQEHPPLPLVCGPFHPTQFCFPWKKQPNHRFGGCQNWTWMGRHHAPMVIPCTQPHTNRTPITVHFLEHHQWGAQQLIHLPSDEVGEHYQPGEGAAVLPEVPHEKVGQRACHLRTHALAWV